MTTPRQPDPEMDASAASLNRRAQQALGPWIAGLASWDWYVTLTYDPKRSPSILKPPTSSTCERQAARYLTSIYEDSRTFVLAVLALENHQSGWPHWHGLVKTGHIPLSDRRALYHPWYNLHGYARIEPVGGQHSLPIADYVAKYLVKGDGTMILDWRPRRLQMGAMQSWALQPSLRQARLEEMRTTRPPSAVRRG